MKKNIDDIEKLEFYQWDDMIRVNIGTTSHGTNMFYDIYYPPQYEDNPNKDKFWLCDCYAEDEMYFNTLDECISYVFKKFHEHLTFTKYNPNIE